MNVEIILRVDGREVAHIQDDLAAQSALGLEEHVEQLKNRAGRVLLEVGFQELAEGVKHPSCCGRRMDNRGVRLVTLVTQSGEITFQRNRYRCRSCGRWLIPADAVMCCGRHRVTRLFARNICQLGTLEHFPRLEQLLADQHGVRLGHDAMMKLIHDVGGAAEQERLAEVEFWQRQPPRERRWPKPEVRPGRVSVSCDGILYCTNETEPDPQHPGERRLIWKQMRVGCVFWQDDEEQWHKQVIWGQEEDFHSFGVSLFRLACRCGYREARDKLFVADGGEWCWTIHQQYFADAAGILDWYHANEHLWDCGRSLFADSADQAAWSRQAETLLYEQGGAAVVTWLMGERQSRRGVKRRAVEQLINYLQPKLDRTDYPTYRSQGWSIGSGMIESTAKQLVGQRLKGAGMHWCPHGATAVTALRAQDLNGRWHAFWKNLVLAN